MSFAVNHLSGFNVGGVTPGSQQFTANGTFVVPDYNTLTVTLWGGGGGGGGAHPTTGATDGVDGNASTFSGLSAGGGLKGTAGNGSVSHGTGGAGGTASGGDTNTNGNAGENGIAPDDGGAGGSAPGGGGAGGPRTTTPGNGANGTAPGGGGAGGADSGTAGAGGGGSGSKVVKTYAPGGLAVGANISVVVGAAVSGGTGNETGGQGARGQVDFSWS